MDEFLSQWSGNFQDHIARPPDGHVEPNPAGAHADSDTDVSFSPVTEAGGDFVAASKRGSSQPPEPSNLPPWKKQAVAPATKPTQHAIPQPKQMPAPRKASSSSAAAQSSSTASSSAVEPSDSVVSQALRDYRAAEKAVSNCAKESLYGAYNEFYYKVEKKVAIEKNISWRDRGPREADQPTFWKSQKWRDGGKRYANRGGKSREHFKKKYGVQSQSSSASSTAPAP